MAQTVKQAFREFSSTRVNLEPQQTATARASRDWLIDQIITFDDNDVTFPNIWNDKNINYGSFERKTKKRPLDDIDTMICLSGNGAYYNDGIGPLTITVPDSAVRLKLLCRDNSNTLDSVKVINKFVAKLKTVPQYEHADVKRNQVAATLKLKSYPWTFDIVPSFFTAVDYWGRDYYLIPDGIGNWQKTDPRMDRKRVQDVNQRHDGNVLNVIRTMKYWNARQTMPTVKSYLLENLILDYYQNRYPPAQPELAQEVPLVLHYIANYIFYPVNDPKNLQGDLNTLSHDQRQRISARADEDYGKAVYAQTLEQQGNQQGAINTWREIFGPDFPCYG